MGVRDLGQTYSAATCETCPSLDRCLPPSLFQHLQDQRSIDLRISSYPTAAGIITQHEPLVGIHIICEGAVAISAERADRREAVLSVEGRDAIMNLEDWLLVRPTYSFTAKTLTDSTIIFVGRDDLRRLFQEDPAIAQIMAAQLARRMEATVRRQIAHLTTTVKSRLVAALYDLLEATGQHLAHDARFDHPISRQLLADIVGAAPESISRAMTELETESLIVRNAARISIPDVPHFIRYSAQTADLAAPP